MFTIPSFRDHYVSVEGIRTRYWKEGSGPPLVLLHGLGGSADHWGGLIRTLADVHQVFVPDLPGYGLSDETWGREYTPEIYARFVRSFMKSVGIGPAAVAGHSMGGTIALHAYFDDPQLIDRLTIMASAGFGRKISLSLRLLSLPFADRVMFRPPYWLFKRGLRRMVFDSRAVTADLASLYWRWNYMPKTKRAMARLVRSTTSLLGVRPRTIGPIMQRAHTIDIPTLVLWGREDGIAPVEQASVAAERIPGARLEILERCGHLSIIEYPDRISRLLLEFSGMEEVPLRRAAQG